MITKDGRDTAIENLTPENYIVPKGEERFYHVVLEIKNFDRKTGKKLSRPYVQKFGRKQFENSVLASLKRQGYDIIILHDPNDWIAEQKVKAADNAKAAREAQAQAEQERINVAVAAALAQEREKLRAEVKAEMEQEAAQKGAEKPAESKDESKDAEVAEKPADDAGKPAEPARKPGRPAKEKAE